MTVRPPTFCEGFHDASSLGKVKYGKLGNTDMIVSTLSYGAGPLGNLYRKTEDSESKRVVHSALKQGVNMIDTAPWYGQGRSESTLGKILADVPRESYYVNTKVCRYDRTFGKMFDFSAERTVKSVEESLARLNVDYIDVIQVHDMEFAKNLDLVINETLPALQKLKEAGKVRHIGITGYPMENFKYVIERSSVKIDSILTYCHGSMNDDTLAGYTDFFKEHNIGVINGSILSMGLLTSRGPPAWHPATKNIMSKCLAAQKYCEAEDVDISRIASDFSFNFPGVDTTLIGTASFKNLQSNLQVYMEGINEKEKTVRNHVIETYFDTLPRKDWDGVELEKYRSAIKEGRLDDTL